MDGVALVFNHTINFLPPASIDTNFHEKQIFASKQTSIISITKSTDYLP